MYAKVVVDIINSNTDELFTYKIPTDFEEIIYIGSRVYVEFGFRKVLGYVIEIIEATEFNGNLKDIIEVIDFEQGLSLEQIELAKKISTDTKSYLISALDLMYPSFMKSKIRKYINVINYDNLDAELALHLGFKKKILVTKDVLTKYQKIKKEIDKGNIEVTSDIYTYGKHKTVKYYSLTNYNFDVKGAMRNDVLTYVSTKDEVSGDDLKANTGCSDLLLKKLVEEKYLKVDERVELFEPVIAKSHKQITYDLNTEQIINKYQKLNGKPFILFSNDEKFKLDFYLDIAIQTINSGKQVLVCTPTILSNNIIYNFFINNLKGYRIFNFTSRLSNNEYYYHYNNVKNQNVDIVITTKLGIFLPLEKIGLIIMIDEENQNYINEQNPKFNTLEVLKYRSNYHNAKLLLSSNSISITTYYHYFTAKYFYLEHIIDYPNQINLINMRNELEDLLLSRLLKEKIKENLDQKQTVMLILNNLSYSTQVICNECGTYLKCPKCRISMVYHKEKNLYRCPYCNLQEEKIKCEKCGSDNFKNLGSGLEKLKERLLELYPSKKIYQIDSLTMNQKTSYEDFLIALEEKEIDIIIGTNILTNIISNEIKLIGIINADTILNMGDYRSSEITYNTISKVVNYPNADVIIQGFNLDHYAINMAVNNKFLDFYNMEIENRKNYNYPPYVEVNKLDIIGDYKDIYYYANYFKKVFSRIIEGDCLGPVYIPKIKGVQILIKHNDFLKLSSLIDEVNKKFKDNKIIVNFERYPSFY